MAMLPLPVALAFGRGTGWLFCALILRNRKRVMENLRQCLPEKLEAERRAIMWRLFANLGMNMADSLRGFGGKLEEVLGRIDVENESASAASFEKGRGIAALTAHLGNWEMLAVWTARHYPITIVTRKIKNGAVQQFCREARAGTNVKLLAAHNSCRACLRVLKTTRCWDSCSIKT